MTATGEKSFRRSKGGRFMIADGTAVDEIEPTTRVCPSGRERATACIPMAPFAPGR